MTELIIRRIEKGDNKKIAEVIRKVFREFKIDKPGTVYTDPTTDGLFELFSETGSVYWIAEINGKISGGCGIYPTDGLPEGYAELVKFYVAADARAKGVGNALMQRSISFAIDTGYKQLYLESFPELNKAISMYVRWGFKPIDHPLGNSGHYACNLWMLKDL
ncbi:hypothetical protein BH09BAC2_BH09BAC2_19070 [soil metagenome]